MIAPVTLGEALVLGVASGPACLAACGPVLVPRLLAGPGGLQSNARTLGIFLGGRLAGYMLFALAAWELGALARLVSVPHGPMVGTVYVLLAGVLLWYAFAARRECVSVCANEKLVQIGPRSIDAMARRTVAPAAMGLLTGLNLCPPFVVAGVRAATAASAAQAMLFFAGFFAGTAVWFLPLAGMGCIRRNENVQRVARMAMAIIAVYYGLMGVALLVGRTRYGY